MNHTNSAVVRLFELYRKIPSSRGQGVTTKQLHESLEAEGFEVSKRTIERDLQKLQSVAGIYSERTDDGNVWRNSSPNLELIPTMQPTEALMFVTAERFLKHVLPPSSTGLLDAKLDKANKTLSSSGMGRFGKWQDKLYIVEGQTPHYNQSLDSDISSTIYKSVLDEKQLNVIYQHFSSDVVGEYLLNPLAIIVREHSHYLVATKFESPEKPQLFNFTRIKQAELTPTLLRQPQHFSVKEFIDTNPTGWVLEHKSYRISMKVKLFAYDWLQLNKLHPTQIIETIDNDWYRVCFDSYVTYDLVGWILRFSTDVVVESPLLLTDEIKRRLSEMVTHY